jgi:hypothetical protein
MLALLPSLVLAAALDVTPAEATCPAAAEVHADLDRLGTPSALSDGLEVEISVHSGRMRVLWHDRVAGGSATREVADPVNCHERALVAAVLITAWASVREQEEARPVTAPPVSKERGELAITGLGVVDGSGLAGGIGAQGGIRWARAVLGALAQFTSSRSRSLASGTVDYGSIASGVSLGWHFDWRMGWLQPELAALAVRWSIQGRNLSASRSASDWGFGLDGRVRLGVVFGGWAPFVFASVQRTLTREHLVLEDRPESTDLPAWNFGFGLGLAYFFSSADVKRN